MPLFLRLVKVSVVSDTVEDFDSYSLLFLYLGPGVGPY